MKNFLYLIQGKKEMVLKQIGKINSDIAILTYDSEIDLIDIRVKGCFFLPNSTWAQGRNKLLSETKDWDYNYFIFMDDDVEFLKGSFDFFENKIIQSSPAIAMPLLVGIKNSGRYNKYKIVQHPEAMDSQILAFHKDVLKKDKRIMPLVIKYDQFSWWYSCEIHHYLIFAFYESYIHQYNDILVDNTNHNWNAVTFKSTDNKSCYKGGINSDILKLVKIEIENNYQGLPKYMNSLFHDAKYNHIYNVNLNAFLNDIYRLRLKSIIIKIKQLYRNFTNGYPKELNLRNKKIRKFYGKI